ncbi:MAG: class I SAM-dependent methyltransferase [Chloracidobacterium sp.]|nr:class I SAM-dependent methyltransferase [Chloracidobacterium sp.]
MPEPIQQEKKKTLELYDRIADVQNLAMKINGYRASVAKFLRSLELKIDEDSIVLDAGSGTGIVSMAFQDAGFHPRRSIALDLSLNSLRISREEFSKHQKYSMTIEAVQGNILRLPFPDTTFDLVLMCGVLEYTPLDEGLREAARVLKPGSALVLLPVKQSLVGSMLELFYNFKIHKLEDVRSAAAKYFNIVGNYEFPITEPIAWSKTIFLLEKK